MITLNNYLYSGNTLLKLLHQYEADLRKHAIETHSDVDMVHSNFLLQIIGLLERNEFLADQSQRLREFYMLMTKEYPFLAFTFRGRIKSLIRAEDKFNAYVIEYISDYYSKNGTVPPMRELRQKLSLFRDFIAYRIVIALPKCHLKDGENLEEKELEYLYEIANKIPAFMEERGFTPELISSDNSSDDAENAVASKLKASVKSYYKDFVAKPSEFGYRSLHITLFDNISNCYTELQLRTKDMDDYATIGPANHLGYEHRQSEERSRRDMIPVGVSPAFDEAWERHQLLQSLDLSKIEVNMFRAYSAELINDGCGLYRGRLIKPFEHLSRFQNDLID